MYSDRISSKNERHERERDRSHRDHPPQHREYRDRDREPHREYRDRDREWDRERDRGRDTDRDRERERDRDRDRHFRDRDVMPQQHVVLQGLSSDATDETVLAQLEKRGACIDTVRVVLDKGTGLAKGFAFVKFMSTQHAIQFMDQHFPHVTLGGARVRMEYSKAAPVSEDDWICTNCGISNFKKRFVCFQCSYSRNDAKSSSQTDIPMEINDGRKDVSTNPSNLLIVLGLDALTSDESFYTAASKPNIPITQVRIIKDRATQMSNGFGFLEFPDIHTASQFLAQFPDDDAAFVVDGRALTLCFASQSAFVSCFERGEFCTSYFRDTNGRVVFLRYRDEAAYATGYPNVLAVLDEEMAAAAAAEAEHARSLVQKKESEGISMEDEFAAFMSEVAAVDVDVLQIAPAPGQEEHPSASVSVERSVGQETVNEADLPLSENGSDCVRAPRSEEDESWDDRVDPWMNRQISTEFAAQGRQDSSAETNHELEANQQTEEMDVEEEEEPPAEPETIDLSDEALLQRLPSVEEINRQKSDLTLMACLLCERQFKGPEDLSKHQIKSGLHKTNMQAFREIQISDLRSELQKQMEQQNAAAAAARGQYRNRAAERRKMYGQPAKVHTDSRPAWVPYPKQKPQHPNGKMSNSLSAAYAMDRAFPVIPAQPTVQGIGEDNIGNKMLRAMGWKEGSGLGAKGDGIVAPIAASTYGKGVGVGSTPIMKL
ncbi:RNA-binding protein 5 [Chytriomyces hyalinus]|nr:RNA-binding protein 5 [Chytriomyces hyalinus]